ncbi:fungal-specific transcription factor domain-containing protein [Coemansia mojavensis]|nr:fungal-specific transcription factor domain-containing protein [Coemansia mojavensis]
MSHSSDFPSKEQPLTSRPLQASTVGTQDTLAPFRQQRIFPNTANSPAVTQTSSAAENTHAESEAKNNAGQPLPEHSSAKDRRPACPDRPENTKRARGESNPPLAPRSSADTLDPPDQHGILSSQPAGQSATSSNLPALQSAQQSSRDMHDNDRSAAVTTPSTRDSQQQIVKDAMPASGASNSAAATAAGSSKSAEPSKAPHSNSSAQKRRLNQACLLCRRKKIRCDSAQPSCSNCHRRGIQCIYPEVRKRGRPPRMYTFADFALPGQPLPPELHGIANVHASAMIASSGAQSQRPGHSSTPSASMHGLNVSVASGSLAHGSSSTGDVNGGSTPGYAHSDYDQSPALPPINVAVGRGASMHSGNYAYIRGPIDPMLVTTPALCVDQAVLHLFEFIMPNFPIIHRQTLESNIRDRSLTLPLWLAIHAVAARFDAQPGSRLRPHHPNQPSGTMSAGYKPDSSVLGAGYAEKAHAMLVNRVGHRQNRLPRSRSERGRVAPAQDPMLELGGVDRDMPRREVIELLQSLILLSIYYAGNWELELAVETHAAAVRIAQRLGVHLIDDPVKLQDASGVFNPAVAQHQRRRAQSKASIIGGPSDIEFSEAGRRSSTSSHNADARKELIECETLRRLWWSMFILDRMYCLCAGSPRMVHVCSFRVRLPCSDLAWDSMHAQPTVASPAGASSSSTANKAPSKQSGLMVRTFREAVMHTSQSEQAANEIAATPSTDPDVYRYFAALAGIIDSIMDFGDDIRALATPPMLEGTEILNQLRSEQAASGYGRSPYARHDMAFPSGSAGADPKHWPTALWLGSRGDSSQFARSSRIRWNAPAVNAVWPPDWRARMRVLKDRAAALESQLSDWYSSIPISQIAHKPYLYGQLPLQDRVTYFYQQIAFYGGVIQLQSLIIMTQGLLLPDALDEELDTFGSTASHGSSMPSALGSSALTSMLWRSLMDVEMDTRQSRNTGESNESVYTIRRRQFGIQSGWGSRRNYTVEADDLRDGMVGEDEQQPTPLDESGNSPEIIREELQRIVHAAWRRCTEAAAAMSSAIRRATEVRRVASANPNAPYYDPTFRPQVLPPYRGDVPHEGAGSANYSSSVTRLDQTPLTGDMHSRQRHFTSTPKQGYSDVQMQQQQHSTLDRQDASSTGYAYHHPLPPLSAPGPRQPIGHGFESGAESAAGFGQAIDDASLLMRFNMFACMAVYSGACVHLHNLKLTPCWVNAAQSYHDAVSKASNSQSLQTKMSAHLASPNDSSMAGGGTSDPDLCMLPSTSDISALPPPLPPPPCTPEQAREGIKPLVRMLEKLSQYWCVSGFVSKIHSMWKDIESSEVSLSQPLPPPSAMTAAGTSSRPAPMSAQDQWSHPHVPPPPPPPPPRSPLYEHMSGSNMSNYIQHRHHLSESSTVPRYTEQLLPDNSTIKTHAHQSPGVETTVYHHPSIHQPPPQ